MSAPASRATDEGSPAAEALARRDWTAAVELLRAAREERPLTTAELDLLGRAAYGAGEFELAVTAWEQAYAASLRSGDDAAAAAAAVTVAVYLLIDTGLMAPIRGWLRRAERLLEGRPESPAHALAAMVRAYERFLCGDADSARRWAREAIDRGLRQGVGVATVLGRVATARLLILDGEVDQGLDLLDEAAVSLVSGELDALAVGMVYCELICAMQGLAQYDRAEQWTEAMDLWRAGTAFGGFNGRCRVHRAEMLRLRGSCAEAEREATAACRELRPWMRREFGWPLTELGTIRLRTGDLAGAEQTLDAVLDVVMDTGDLLGQASTLACLGAVKVRQGRHGAAEQDLATSLAISRRMENNPIRGRALLTLAELSVAQRDWNRANALVSEGLVVFSEIGSAGVMRARFLAVKARIDDQFGNPMTAAAARREALQLVGDADTALSRALAEAIEPR